MYEERTDLGLIVWPLLYITKYDQNKLAFEVLKLGSCVFFVLCRDSHEDSKLSKK